MMKSLKQFAEAHGPITITLMERNNLTCQDIVRAATWEEPGIQTQFGHLNGFLTPDSNWEWDHADQAVDVKGYSVKSICAQPVTTGDLRQLMSYFAGERNLAPKAAGQDHGMIEVVAHPGGNEQIGVATQYIDRTKNRSFYKITLTGKDALDTEFLLEGGEFKEIR
jgi:hypothetical protein